MIFEKVVYGSVTVLDLMVVALILIATLVVTNRVSYYLRRFLKDKLERSQVQLTSKVVSATIIVIVVISLMPILGLNLSGLFVAGGIAGLVVGFASQRIVANLISGLFLIFERPINIGNQVNIDGTMGFVEDIRIMSTILRTYDGLFVRIPNEKVFTTNITNYVSNVARRFDYRVGIRYMDDADRAIGIIKRTIEKHPFALEKPEPLIFVDNLGDNAVEILVRTWAPATEWYSLKMKLLWEIKVALEEEGIEIAFPQRTVWFANELEKRELADTPPRDRTSAG